MGCTSGTEMLYLLLAALQSNTAWQHRKKGTTKPDYQSTGQVDRTGTRDRTGLSIPHASFTANPVWWMCLTSPFKKKKPLCLFEQGQCLFERCVWGWGGVGCDWGWVVGSKGQCLGAPTSMYTLEHDIHHSFQRLITSNGGIRIEAGSRVDPPDHRLSIWLGSSVNICNERICKYFGRKWQQARDGRNWPFSSRGIMYILVKL